MENLLNAENLKYNELAQRKLNGVSTAIDRKEFKKSLDLARDIRTSMKLYGLDEENLKRWENWAQTHEAEKEGNRKKLKKAEEQLGNYDYENALKSFDEGFRNFNNLWAVSDPEPPHYSKLREEAFTKNKRLAELISALSYAAGQSPVPPAHVLKQALKTGEEATVLQPGNTAIKGYIKAISARLQKLKDETESLMKGRRYLDEGRKAESVYLSQMATLQANPDQKDGHLEQSANVNLSKAVDSFTISLNYVPDKNIENHIKELKVNHIGKMKDIENRRLAKRFRIEADKLWTEGGNLYKQGKENDALVKLKESIGYWSDQERIKYVQDLENQINRKKGLCKNLWDEGSRLQNANRLSEALAKFMECQRTCPTAEMAQHIRNLD